MKTPKDPFYSEPNISYLKKQIDDYKSDTMEIVQHPLIEDEEEIPNAETLEAFEELASGRGHVFHGTVEEFFKMLESLPDDDDD